MQHRDTLGGMCVSYCDNLQNMGLKWTMSYGQQSDVEMGSDEGKPGACDGNCEACIISACLVS